MKVILLNDIKNIGKKDDIINTSDGYARNYLFPKKLAIEATKDEIKKLNDRKSSEKYKEDLEKQNALQLAEKLQQIELKIKVNAGDSGKIFGGVTPKEISENLKDQYDVKIDKKKIEIKETIKLLGEYKIDVKIYKGVSTSLKVIVYAD